MCLKGEIMREKVATWSVFKWGAWSDGRVNHVVSTPCWLHDKRFNLKRLFSNCWYQASTVALLTLSSDVSTSMKVFHPTIKLLQCAESEEESEPKLSWRRAPCSVRAPKAFTAASASVIDTFLKSLACMSAHSSISTYASSHLPLWPWECDEGAVLGVPPWWQRAR